MAFGRTQTTGNPHGIISAKLDPDLYEAVRERCATMSVTPSEVVRTLLVTWINGEAAETEQTFSEAKRMATTMFQVLASRFAEALPETYEELVELLQDDE
jgi:antitoxin component of RelBE/YafQ-DinJ toxin-antitoxin module